MVEKLTRFTQIERQLIQRLGASQSRECRRASLLGARVRDSSASRRCRSRSEARGREDDSELGDLSPTTRGGAHEAVHEHLQRETSRSGSTRSPELSAR